VDASENEEQKKHLVALAKNNKIPQWATIEKFDAGNRYLGKVTHLEKTAYHILPSTDSTPQITKLSPDPFFSFGKSPDYITGCSLLPHELTKRGKILKKEALYFLLEKFNIIEKTSLNLRVSSRPSFSSQFNALQKKRSPI